MFCYTVCVRVSGVSGVYNVSKVLRFERRAENNDAESACNAVRARLTVNFYGIFFFFRFVQNVNILQFSASLVL